MHEIAKPPTTLVMKHSFAASRERLFEAWTTPEMVREFIAPDEIAVPEVRANPRVRGRFRIVIERPDGGRRTVHGTYRELEPPERIACTWQWEEHKTLLTLEFASIGETTDMTELTLTHENFRDAAQRDAYARAWGDCFAKLDRLL